MRAACAAAVDAALGAGATYADARAILRRSQSVGTRNGRVITLTDAESEGIGVRVLAFRLLGRGLSNRQQWIAFDLRTGKNLVAVARTGSTTILG